MIARRDLIEKIGGFDDRFEGLYEDQVFLAKATLVAPTYVSHEVWARYRQHGRATTTVATPETEVAMRKNYIRWLVAYVREQNIEDERLWRALRAAR